MYQIIDLNQEKEWLSALGFFPDTDVFYQPGYCRAFQENGGGRGILFVEKTGDDLAVYPVFLRSLQEMPLFRGLSEDWLDISSPYGYAGPLFSNPGNTGLQAAFQKSFRDFCREQHVVSEFIRFHPLLDNRTSFNDFDWARTKKVVSVNLQRPESAIWQNYTYSNRKNINTARRHGLKVIIEEKSHRISAFLEIYQETMERRGVKRDDQFSPGFFTTLCRGLQGQFAFAFVFREEEMISAELLLFNSRFIHSFLGGTRQASFNCRPNNLLKHEIILWARERGISYFLLGGGYGDDDGIFRYKTGFAPDGIRDVCFGGRIHHPETYKLLTELRNNDSAAQAENDFFPAYRR